MPKGLKKNIGDFKRLQKILSVFFEAGFEIFIDQLKLRWLVSLKCRIKCFLKRCHQKCYKTIKPKIKEREIPLPIRLRLAFEELGASFIKLGQILSVRPDIVGEKYANELKKLQDNVPPFTYKEAKEIIESELGKPIVKLFKKFEKKPIAAASLAQVHRAYLPTGEEVAVKIQRPKIREVIEKDIHLLFYVAHLMEKYVKVSRIYRPVKIAKEFADWTIKELDFTVEANSMDRFRYNFREDSTIMIPKVYRNWTTTRVLTMEFSHGVRADDLKALRKIKNDPEKLAKDGIKIGLKQFLIDGFFHADPHPGNFFALPNNILCLHDFGIVGYLTPKMRKKLVGCVISFSNKDVEGYLRYLLSLAETDKYSDIESFSGEVSNILSQWFYSPSEGKSLAMAFYKVINLGARYGIMFPSDLVLFGKALLTVEAMGLKLYPKLDFNKEFEPFVKEVFKAELDPKKMAKTAPAQLFDYLTFIKELPSRTQKLVEKIEKGDLELKIDPREVLEIKEEMDRQNDIRILAIIMVTVVLGSMIVLRLEEKTAFLGLSLGRIGLIISGFLLVWLMILVRRKNK